MNPTPENIDYEYLVELGLEASRRMDKDRFYIGHLALMVETHYSEKTLADFARRICISKSSVYDYRGVARMFRDFPPLGKFLNKDEFPSLCFVHFRAASRLKSEAEIMAYLEQQTALMTTPDQVISGNDKEGYGVSKMAEFEAEIGTDDDYYSAPIIYLPDDVQLQPGIKYIIRIYQINEE